MHEVEHQTKWKERLAIDEWNKLESKLPRLLSFGSLITDVHQLFSGKWSFSQIALIKNKLRTTMKQDRLNNVTIMSIESNNLFIQICVSVDLYHPINHPQLFSTSIDLACSESRIC